MIQLPAMLALKALPWRAILLGGAAMAVALTVFLGYRHYEGVLDDLASERANRARLETAVQLQDQTITSQADAISLWQASNNSLVERLAIQQLTSDLAQAETRRLHDILQQHDLDALAAAKPGLIQRRVNTGTDRALRLLECASAGTPAADCAD